MSGVGAVLAQALSEYRAMRKAGVSRDDAIKGLELVLRDHLPKGRGEPWHYYCSDCQDTGLRRIEIERLHRRGKPDPIDLYGEPASYLEPCICAQGREWAEA